MTLTRDQLLALSAEHITALLECVSDVENDEIIAVLAAFQDTCEIEDNNIPNDVLNAFIV